MRFWLAIAKKNKAKQKHSRSAFVPFKTVMFQMGACKENIQWVLRCTAPAISMLHWGAAAGQWLLFWARWANSKAGSPAESTGERSTCGDGSWNGNLLIGKWTKPFHKCHSLHSSCAWTLASVYIPSYNVKVSAWNLNSWLLAKYPCHPFPSSSPQNHFTLTKPPPCAHCSPGVYPTSALCPELPSITHFEMEHWFQ